MVLSSGQRVFSSLGWAGCRSCGSEAARTHPTMAVLRTRRFWIGIGLSLLCLWLALRNVPFLELGRALARARYVWLVPAAALEVLAVLARGRRWEILLGREGILVEAFWAQGIGYLFTNILPFRVGEAARAIVLSGRSRLPIFQVAASILVERLLDVATVVAALILVLPWMQVPLIVVRAGTTFGILVLLGLVGLWLLVRFRQAGERLLTSLLNQIPRLPSSPLLARWREMIEGLAPLTRFPAVWRSVVWSGCTWALSIGVYWCVLQAFEEQSTVVEATFMVVALSLALTVPSSPGFIGVFQLVGQQALVLPFGGKYDQSTALAATLTAHLVYYLITSLLGAIGLWRTGESFADLGKRLLTSRSRGSRAAVLGAAGAPGEESE